MVVQMLPPRAFCTKVGHHPTEGFGDVATHTPKENTPDVLVGASGFEPEASCAQGRRATRLRYAPTGLSLHSSVIYEFHSIAHHVVHPSRLSHNCARIHLIRTF